jgi:hypothetical protein
LATTLKFKQGDSGTELNLNSTTTGFRLEEYGWTPVVATPVHMGDPPPVIETLDLFVSNTNYNNISSNMQSLHEMQVLADRYINDPQQEEPVWLHAKMDGETGERRALVRSITVQYKHPWFGAGEATTNIPLTLTVVREPYWESTSVRNLPDAAPSAAACVVYDYTAAGDAVSAHNIVGDVGARLRYFTLQDNAADGTSRFWMGFRSANKHGANGISNFITTWECEDGTNNASETGITDEVDATASGGNMVEVTENLLNWDAGTFLVVLKIDLNDVTANEEDQFGNFLWLLRAKVDSGTWEVRLHYYWRLTAGGVRIDPVIKDAVEITNTNWANYEMGIHPISGRDIHAITEGDITKDNEGAFTVAIYARRTSGTGDLNVDCLIPIPIDEGSAKLSWTDAGSQTFILAQSPEGIYATAIGSSSILEVGRAIDSINNFVLPVGDGRIYCVYERWTGVLSISGITDVVTFNPADVGRYYERWLSLRGSE